MIMDVGRVSHPSMAQGEALVQYLEGKPHLAKGFLRNQSAKAQANKEWDYISMKLNSIGGGTLKTTKKWIKYWADKKNAVKRKAAARAAARRRTGGGNEEVPELNEVEERIVALMGGGGFATGGLHLQLQVFDEPTPAVGDSPSVLSGYSGQNILSDQPAGSSITVDHVYPSTHPHEVDMEPLTGDTPNRRRTQPALNNQPTVDLQAPAREISPIATTSARAAGERHNSPPHNTASAVSTPRRRRFRIRRSPPSQRRSQFASVAEKFLKIEEQRLAFEQRMLELVAQANIAIGEGLKALADAIKKN